MKGQVLDRYRTVPYRASLSFFNFFSVKFILPWQFHGLAGLTGDFFGSGFDPENSFCSVPGFRPGAVRRVVQEI